MLKFKASYSKFIAKVILWLSALVKGTVAIVHGVFLTRLKRAIISPLRHTFVQDE